MVSDYEKIEKAKAVLLKMAKGIDPLTGEVLSEDSFLNDPRIIRCFYFVTEVLDNVIKGTYSKSNNTGNSKALDFIITPEQKSRVVFPEGKIGVNEFSKCVNECIDLNTSKKLTGIELNKRLKKLGILSEVDSSNGKTRTITNENSEGYGFELEKRSFRGTEYEAVVINDTGKKYLIANLETIMKANV